MGGHKKQTVGYKYYLGIHMVLCHGPIDKITHIICGDKVAWSGSSTGGQIHVDKSQLFGGKDAEGGIYGYVDIDMGLKTQVQNAYLVDQLGSDIPAYRGVVSAVLNQCYIGTSAYIKLWKFRASRVLTLSDGSAQWNPSKAPIGNDINPAHMIRECLTSSSWGMGYSDQDIDEVSFSKSASTMYSEGMGMSLLWDKQTSIEDFLSTVVRHIDGSLYVDRVTGKFVLNLVRDDYDIGSLLLLDESNISGIRDFSRPVIGELVNSVTAVFWDQNTGKDSSITAQDVALIQSQGSVIATTVQYPGFTTGDNASRAASRDLVALSTPLISCTIKANREASYLDIGDAFKLSWLEYGISEVVMRVTSLGFGGISNSEVLIGCSQDVFSIGSAVVIPPPVSEWVDPVSAPTYCSIRKMYEATYWDIVLNIGQAQADALPDTGGYIMIGAVSPTSDSFFANLYTPSLGLYSFRAEIDFCASAVTDEPISYMDTTFAIFALDDEELITLGTHILIDSEFMRVDAISNTSITVGRGVLDTVPKEHPNGTRIYFTGEHSGSDLVVYATGETPDAKLAPVTGQGEYDVSSSPIDTITMVGRAFKPYVPGNFKINGSYFPVSIDNTVDLTVSWSHRSRTQQVGEEIFDFTAGNIGPESGVTYVVTLYSASNAVLQEVTGITGTSQVFTVLQMDPETTVKVRVKSVRDGVDSYQNHYHSIDRV